MTRINKRLDDLENESGKKSGHAVLYADFNNPGEYTERSPYLSDPGKRYTEAERRELENQIETLIVIEYVEDWNPTGAGRGLHPGCP